MSQTESATTTRSIAATADIRWRTELYELISDADSTIHRIMQQCLDSAARTNSQIAGLIEEAMTAYAEERDALRRELIDAQHELETTQQFRSSGPPAVQRPDVIGEATSLITAARDRMEKDLSPIRTTIRHLRSIEYIASTALSLEAGESVGKEDVTQPLIATGINTYRQAVALMQSIHDGRIIREVDIFSYQPGRLVLLLTVRDAGDVAGHVLSTSVIQLIRLPDDAGALAFRVSS